MFAGTKSLLSLFGRRLRRPYRRMSALYQRSIQVRVVAITLVLSLGAVLLLGLVVMKTVRNGLLQAKDQAAVTQAENGFKAAVSQGTAFAGTAQKNGTNAAGSGQPGTPGADGLDMGTLLSQQVSFLASSGAGQYMVVGMVPDTGIEKSKASVPREVGGVDPDRTISTAFRDSVVENSGTYQAQYTTIYYTHAANKKPESGLVVGKTLTITGAGAKQQTTYQLYYVFPFTLESQTLNLVGTTLATAGIFVVVLLGAISWLVVRQVVTPVRMAAEISERLADGRLDERMKVSGTDDIARLGESFNRMGAALQTQIRQLEELSRVQRRFVSDVSHELRTPLTTVRMAADLLYESRDDFGDPAAERSAELLQNQLDRFESLLADLLEISRFDAGAAILDAEPADLRDVVGRVIEAAEPLARTKGSNVVVRGADEPVVAEVDPRRIERVLRNLVVNALEHGEGNDIEVVLAAGDGAVAVAVRDHGIGLKPGEASRVFNRFWRADPARARTTGGTGLGLSIALEDAALHGGWLHAWGEPGGGSQFRLTLPRNAGGEILRSPIPLEPADSLANRGLAVPGMPYMRASRVGSPRAAEAPEPGGAAVLGTGLGSGLGGVLGYGSVIPETPGRAAPPPSNPADVRASSGYGVTGAQVVVSKEGRVEGSEADDDEA
ncbi:MtrAB system histidine kinase MtrB [Streptacidiphilus carbonis]|uniref:MtrAB system histidine kinase MtrB n=1 Tax=Streptacidiphilus carbonis TaxID=105422 RepID=UPI000694E902|nr:MtrAB system histidine kinase MtrB [Streptacidiphilus carbonis]